MLRVLDAHEKLTLILRLTAECCILGHATCKYLVAFKVVEHDEVGCYPRLVLLPKVVPTILLVSRLIQKVLHPYLGPHHANLAGPEVLPRACGAVAMEGVFWILREEGGVGLIAGGPFAPSLKVLVHLRDRSRLIARWLAATLFIHQPTALLDYDTSG